MPWWVDLAMAGSLFAVAVPPAFTAEVPPCDLEALRHYPMTEVLKKRAAPLAQLTDGRFYLFDENEALRSRLLLAAELAAFQAVERPIVMLAAIDRWTSGADGILTFFLHHNGAFLEEALEALEAEGLAAHAALFRDASAIFGTGYATPQERFGRWMDKNRYTYDPSGDPAVLELSVRHRALANLLEVAAERIARSPDLSAIYQSLRAGVSEDERFAFLLDSLWRSCLDSYRDPDAVPELLARLPAHHRQVIILELFAAELSNEGMKGFFFESPGDLAPDVVEVLRAMGLQGQAAAVERGMDMFPKPYPRKTDARRDFLWAEGDGLEKALHDLTAELDEGAMRQAAISFARSAGILPRVD